VPYYNFDEFRFYDCDGAPPAVARKRKQALKQLQRETAEQAPQTLNFAGSLKDSISDVNFTSAYRVPFPFREHLGRALKLGSVVEETEGVKIRDLDGNWRYDVSGSYGVNVFGYDFYKDCIEEGSKRVRNLGPVLGPYHPVIRENVEIIKRVSGLDEVSFHMSGTEAVMQAVRLARYHTGRSHLVRLCGAYHGWWDGVQPGVGNQRKANDVYTLRDMSERTLKVLATRKDIACVLINPLQALHPNSDAPGDATLVSSKRTANFDREAYTAWLQRIREVCTQRGIVLIMDEVFTGFRLAYRGAQEYFAIQADMVTYGKTLGGGLPVGVLTGRADLMKRFKDDQPANISFARGTFNSHPYVMASMNAFLRRIETPRYQAIYEQADALWNRRTQSLNRHLADTNVPVRVANMHSVLTVLYQVPCRYNWMLQFYLRAEGLELSWIGSGRMIMSLDFSDEDFEQVTQRFVQACRRMQSDSWWWQPANLTAKDITRQLVTEMLRARFGGGSRGVTVARPSLAAKTVEDVQ
jgi:glutamate-1-semialdehyde 2,1-aminomutase